MSPVDRPISGPRVLFRRSPYLISYWSPDGLVLENYATGRRGGGAPRVHDILSVFDRWRPVILRNVALVIEGKIQNRDGVILMKADHFEALPGRPIDEDISRNFQ